MPFGNSSPGVPLSAVVSAAQAFIALQSTAANQGADFEGDDGAGGVVTLDSRGGLYVFPSDATADRIRLADTGQATVFRVTPAGQVIATALPTADPLVAGSIYSVAGTLHVSAG